MSRYAGKLIKLVPTDWQVPTFEIDGIKMLPTLKESPLDDARRKVGTGAACGQDRAGYLRRAGLFRRLLPDAGVARLQSFEKNEDVLWLRTINQVLKR